MRDCVAYLDWSLEVRCGNCSEIFDIAEFDHDGYFANAIFTNKWGSLEGADVECPKCSAEVKLDRVEY